MRILPALLLFLLPAALPARAAGPDPDRGLVFISVDGLAHFYWDDPKAEMPTLRRLAAEGAHAVGMKATAPTVTWPNHTTLVTGVPAGRHGVIGNNYFDRAAGRIVTLLTDPVYDKEEIVKAPTIYDAAKVAGLKTAAVLWPASRNAKTLDWTVPDVATNELYQKFSTPSLLPEWRAAGLPFENYEEWCVAGKYDERDRLNTRIFTQILRTHRPNLSLLHLINVDHMEHGFGPQTPEAYAAIKEADAQVGQVWEELQRAFPGKATIVVVSDHGFVPIRQAILPNVVLGKAGLLRTDGLAIRSARVLALSQGGSAFIYVLDAANRRPLLDGLVPLFQGVEGVHKVLRPEDYEKYGLATPDKDPHMPDLLLFAKPGYTFGDTAGGVLAVTAKSAELRGTHGHDPDDPALLATFVAAGYGVKPGVKLGEVQNVDAAPTAAALLGFEMKDVTGKVLGDVLAGGR